MAEPKRSKTVDLKVREAWAALAVLAFDHAKIQVKAGQLSSADDTMSYVETWTDQAGFEAMRYRSFY